MGKNHFNQPVLFAIYLMLALTVMGANAQTTCSAISTGAGASLNGFCAVPRIEPMEYADYNVCGGSKFRQHYQLHRNRHNIACRLWFG